MNWKTFILLGALFLGALPSARAVGPMTYKEIAMLLRNGENPQFMIEETTRRKLLQPLSPEEERTLLSMHASPALMTLLRDPATIASPQTAAAYAAQLEQQKSLARLAAQQDAENARRRQPTNVAPNGNTAPKGGNGLAGQPLNLKFDAADGSPVDLARLRGKVVLIDFWATWCGPCMKEVPNVVAAYQKYHGKGFEIIGISLDQSKDAMLRTTAQKGMTWPQYFDGKGWGNAISSGFHIQSIPTMWLVNKNGVVAFADARADLEGEIVKLLAE